MSANPQHSSDSVEHYTPASVVEAARATLGGFDLDPFSCDEANQTVRARSYFDGVDSVVGTTRFPRRGNGWIRPWHGRVFINPPGGLVDSAGRRVEKNCRDTGSCGLPPGHKHHGTRAAQKRAWFKLAEEYKRRRVKSAIFVCFSLELLQSTQTDRGTVGPVLGTDGQPLPIPLDFPICYPAKRLEYLAPGGRVGEQPTHASCVILLPPRDNVSEFYGVFASFSCHFGPIGRVVFPES